MSKIKRTLEPFTEFRDGELIYAALAGAVAFLRAKELAPGLVGKLEGAAAIRESELQDYYDSQRYKERT